MAWHRHVVHRHVMPWARGAMGTRTWWHGHGHLVHWDGHVVAHVMWYTGKHVVWERARGGRDAGMWCTGMAHGAMGVGS